MFPDGNRITGDDWCLCCLDHDLAYWRGGTEKERLAADERLKRCIAERTGDALLAQAIFTGVRIGGSPHFPTWYRWGYGWIYGRGYRPLSKAEELLVEKKLSAFRNSRADIACDTRF